MHESFKCDLPFYFVLIYSLCALIRGLRIHFSVPSSSLCCPPLNLLVRPSRKIAVEEE